MSIRVEAGFHHLQQALAELLAEIIEFPRGVFVTIIGTEVTANTSHARVTLSVFPVEQEQEVLRYLTEAEHEIKDELSKRLMLRRIPKLHYVFDRTEDQAAIIEEEIGRVKKVDSIQLEKNTHHRHAQYSPSLRCASVP